MLVFCFLPLLIVECLPSFHNNMLLYLQFSNSNRPPGVELLSKGGDVTSWSE